MIKQLKKTKKWRWTDYFKSSDLKLDKKHYKPTVFVAMSGGVDSSVTAYLLKKQGYQVVGMFMKNWSYPTKSIKECPLYQDYLDMISVCKFLKIPYQVVSFEKEYKKRVIDDFFKDYRAGKTPNPDVLCNREIKFDLFLKAAIKKGADLIATGHHIRSRCVSHKTQTRHPELDSLVGQTGSKKIPDQVRNDKLNEKCEEYQLLKGKDPIKDQTYFVYPITQDQLAKSLFPIGNYIKDDIRAIAKKINLPTATKRDSQGICFIGRIDAKVFLKTRLEQKTGDIIDKTGKKMGKHEGAWFYTIGQRRIEGLSGTIKPMYVISTDINKNLVVVGDDKDTYSKVARLESLHLINPKMPKKDLINQKFKAKSRYTPELTSGTLKKDAKGYYFIFSKPERAITVGQSLVLYKNQVCIGGGVISLPLCL